MTQSMELMVGMREVNEFAVLSVNAIAIRQRLRTTIKSPRHGVKPMLP